MTCSLFVHVSTKIPTHMLLMQKERKKLSKQTFSWISCVDCASQNATVAKSFRMGISTVQSLPSSRATSGRGCMGPFMIWGLIPADTHADVKHTHPPVLLSCRLQHSARVMMITAHLIACGGSVGGRDVLLAHFVSFTLSAVYLKKRTSNQNYWAGYYEIIIVCEMWGGSREGNGSGCERSGGLASVKWALDTSNGNTNDMVEPSLHQSGRNQTGDG